MCIRDSHGTIHSEHGTYVVGRVPVDGEGERGYSLYNVDEPADDGFYPILTNVHQDSITALVEVAR